MEMKYWYAIYNRHGFPLSIYGTAYEAGIAIGRLALESNDDEYFTIRKVEMEVKKLDE